MKRRFVFLFLITSLCAMIFGVFVMSRQTRENAGYVFPKANTIDGVRYETTVPTECIHSDGRGDYIIVLGRRTDYWLNADVEVKKYVTVLAANDWYCAIEADEVYMNTMIKK